MKTMKEEITWTELAAGLPDADTLVLLALRSGDEPVWLGYLDGDILRFVEGEIAEGVTHWAHLPAGPNLEVYQ